ncbi:putative reverse transcriptase/RNA-dependent DNA polymerase [Citrus sinensis]|uniref:Reverse transcriptase/RNA-dependent DNA polymerase n=1 Tax=Citrus sinensis TaxID=2711 RepID=A0ACB8KDW6_CITSI|nr:putative reverse transcriptase/RNA-dependent DNA polymerase [Citrus sinensis]
MNSFWWGSIHEGRGGIRWMKWNLLCKPKTTGGIGFKNLHAFNVAMLGKQVWKLLTNPESLLGQIFKARYFPRTSIVEAVLGHNPSFVWRSLLAAKHIIVRSSRIQVGSGQNTLIGSDPWLPDADNGFISTSLNESIVSAPISSLMVPGQRRWDYDAVADLFDTRDRNLILQIPLSSRREKDVWYWMADPHGLYTVRSCYRLLNNYVNAPTSGIWRKIWSLEVPSKVKTCWLTSSLGLIGPQPSFLNWLELVFSCCNKEMCNLVAMICWRIWHRRNEKVWNNKVCSVRHVLNSAGNYLFQWQTARQKSEVHNATCFQGCHGAICWTPPQLGWLKCNGSFATLMGFLWRLAVHLSWVVLVQGMLKRLVFKALTASYSCPNGYGLILDDCLALAKSIGDIEFSFVRRSANTAAHVTARVGGSLSGFEEWNHVPPPWLFTSL